MEIDSALAKRVPFETAEVGNVRARRSRPYHFGHHVAKKLLILFLNYRLAASLRKSRQILPGN